MSGDEDCVTYLGVPCDSNFGSENFKPVIMNYSLGNSTLNMSPDGLALDGPSTYVEVAIFVIVCFVLSLIGFGNRRRVWQLNRNAENRVEDE